MDTSQFPIGNNFPTQPKTNTTMLPQKQLQELSTETLIQYHANARTTRMGAGGHGKAHHNELCRLEYKAILDARGVDPKTYQNIQGEFNGDGSY